MSYFLAVMSKPVLQARSKNSLNLYSDSVLIQSFRQNHSDLFLKMYFALTQCFC
ncbi:hypothetical protein PSBY109024_02315 [Pseudoalteromonas byunsanensis]